MTRPRTLVVDENFPNAGRDAGSVAIVSHIKSLIRLGHETHFLATSRKPVSGPLAERLLATGCKLAGQGGETVVQTIATAARDFQFIYAQRRDATQTVVDSARGGAARIVYGLADLHHIRLARQAVVQKNSKLLELAAASSRQELALARQAYAVITPSTLRAPVSGKPSARPRTVPLAGRYGDQIVMFTPSTWPRFRSRKLMRSPATSGWSPIEMGLRVPVSCAAIVVAKRAVASVPMVARRNVDVGGNDMGPAAKGVDEPIRRSLRAPSGPGFAGQPAAR